MCKRLFAFAVVALVFVSTGYSAVREAASPAMPMPASPDAGVCGVEEPHCISHQFSPGNNSFVYDFTGFAGSTLLVDFVGGVTRTFTLTVRDHTLTDEELTARLDPRVFQTGTSCFHYSDNLCHEYAFSGDATGPNGVPVLRMDYNRPGIRLKLTYFPSFSEVAHNPAFAHAPGESTTFSEDILADYFNAPPDDTMCSDPIPGLSNVIALNEPLEENDTYCWVSPSMDGQTFKVGDEVEVAFRLFASGPCPGTGTPLRDRDARVSLAKVNGEVVFQDVRIKHFHFDHKEGVNRTKIDTEGLTPGTYFITVRSDEFSPQTRQISLVP